MTLPSHVLAVDHRVQLLEAAKARGRGPEVQACREFKSLVAEAFLRARSRSSAVAEGGGLILDHELGADGLRRARAAGVPVGQPLELSGVTPLTLYPDFEQVVLAQRPAFAKCLVLGRPDDPPAPHEAQNATVQRLAHACERAGVPLVLELITPARPGEDLPDFERRRPELTARWMRALSAQGVRPAEWKLEGFDTAEAFAQVAGACQGEERIVILGKSVPEAKLARWFQAGRASKRCSGFAVGRTIFWDPFLGHLSGASADRTVTELCDRYLRVVDLWESSAP